MRAFVDALELYKIGYSWVGVASLALAYDTRRIGNRTDYGDRIVRLNIGLENTADLIADLDRGLGQCGAEVQGTKTLGVERAKVTGYPAISRFPHRDRH